MLLPPAAKHPSGPSHHEEGWKEEDTSVIFEEWLVLELSKLYPTVQDNLTSTNNTHTPTKRGGHGENNIIQDISDRVQTVHTAQNASLLTVRKVKEGGGAIEQCQAQEITSTEFDLCSRKIMSEQEHKKICGPGDILMAGTYKENIHQNNVQIPNICQEYAHQ